MKNPSRPNVVFILVDNIGWRDFGVYGGLTATPRIDASAFMLGKSKTTGRESYLFFGPDAGPMSVKWKNIKVIFRYANSFETPYWPRVYDLSSDPHEDYNLMVYKLDMTWMLGAALKYVADYQQSVAEHPNIKPGEDFTGYS